jgi:hypothetical protein
VALAGRHRRGLDQATARARGRTQAGNAPERVVDFVLATRPLARQALPHADDKAVVFAYRPTTSRFTPAKTLWR